MKISLWMVGAVGWIVLILYWHYLGKKEKIEQKPPSFDAYEMAVAHGFSGTYKEWFTSLRQPRKRLKKGEYVEWGDVYASYFDHYDETMVRYTDPFNCSYVLRIPLLNPYQPYSPEYKEHQLWNGRNETYEQWRARYRREYVNVFLRHEQTAHRKMIRGQVDKRIRTQRRHPSRQHAANV
jgi:hypothetical protein